MNSPFELFGFDSKLSVSPLLERKGELSSFARMPPYFDAYSMNADLPIPVVCFKRRFIDCLLMSKVEKAFGYGGFFMIFLLVSKCFDVFKLTEKLGSSNVLFNKAV